MVLNAVSPERLRDLAALVIKEGVGLGGLSATHRSWALALVWAGLPAQTAPTERQINEWLKAQLTGAAAFLDIDHVELRRWLVDAGWLTRDGYGREYRRVGRNELDVAQREFADALAGIDPATWAAEMRAAHSARREARRARWQAGSRPTP